MVGLCGEFPSGQLNRLIESDSYAEKVVTDVKMILSKLYVAKRSFPGNASSLVQAAFFSAWKGVSQLNIE